MTSTRQILGFIAMAVVVVIWASFALSIRAAETSTLSAGDVAFLRFVVAAVLLIPFIPSTVKAVRQESWIWTVLIIAGGGLPFLLLVQVGGSTTSASLVGTVPPGTVPVFLTVFGAALGTSYNVPRWAGVLSISLGVLIAIMAGTTSSPWGITILLIAGAMWSLYVLAVSKTNYKPLHIAVLLAVPSALGVGALAVTGVTPITLFTSPPNMSEVITYGLLQGVVIGIISTVLYSFAISNIGAGRSSLMGAASPVLSTVVAIPLLGEVPEFATIVCLVLVSAGAIVANFWGRSVLSVQPKFAKLRMASSAALSGSSQTAVQPAGLHS